jgi:acyl-coenzyme A synthetase/AMP-(fatty) acid ligase
MLLRTSGTTAKPKVVALKASHLLHSGASLGFGLKLSSEDVSTGRIFWLFPKLDQNQAQNAERV